MCLHPGNTAVIIFTSAQHSCTRQVNACGSALGPPLGATACEGADTRQGIYNSLCAAVLSHFHFSLSCTGEGNGNLAWRIPGTGEPGGLPSMGLRRVGQTEAT